MDNRKQMVTINGELINKKTKMHGVLQCSVFGSVLFIIYIKDLCNIRQDELLVNTNYTCLLFSNDSLKTVKNKEEIGVNRVFKELNNRKLSLNINKFIFIDFSIRNIFIFTINEN